MIYLKVKRAKVKERRASCWSTEGSDDVCSSAVLPAGVRQSFSALLQSSSAVAVSPHCATRSGEATCCVLKVERCDQWLVAVSTLLNILCMLSRLAVKLIETDSVLCEK